MFGTVGYVIGQVLSGISVLIGFISFQQKTPARILTCEILSASVFAAHYFLIGAPTAVALNLLAAVQCVAYYFRDKRGSRSMVVPLIFTALVITSGILTWEGWHSAFIVFGLGVYSVSIAFPNAQSIRYAMFLKSPACLVYNAVALSVGGVAYECAVLISSLIGTVKNRAAKNKQ